jgi:hypothetical protein
MSPLGDIPLPTNEKRVRQLARIPDPEVRQDVWEQVVG